LISPVIVLAGGLGSRLGELSQQLPKAMMDVAGVPFIDFKLRQLSELGFSKVILAVGYLAEQIQDYCGEGSRWNLDIKYSLDPFKSCGTGRAVENAIRLHLLDQGRCFVTYGDSLNSVDPKLMEKSMNRPFHPEVDAEISIIDKDLVPGHAPNCAVIGPGLGYYFPQTLSVDSQVPLTHVEYGMTLIDKTNYLNWCPASGPLDFGEFLYSCSKEMGLGALEVQKPFHEIGNIKALDETRKWITDEWLR
jgi:hypothetical protein